MAIKLYKSQVNVTKQSSSVPTAKLDSNFGQAVFEGQQSFLNTTMQIEQKHRQIQEDKDVIKTTTDYNEDLNEIINNTSKQNNLEEGIASYDAATNELYKNVTSGIQNKNVKRRVEEHINKVSGAYRIDVGASIRKNSIKVFEDSLDLKKNQTFNQILTGNAALQLQLKDELFGNAEKGIPGMYDQYAEAGILTPGVTRETFNQALKNDFDVSEATHLIQTNVNQFLEKDKKGGYNNLEPKTLLNLRSTANAQLKSAQTINNKQLTVNKKLIEDDIKSSVNILKKGYMVNEEETMNLMVDAMSLNTMLPDDKQIDISPLVNAAQIFEYANEFKYKSTEAIDNELMAKETEIMQLSNTDGVSTDSLILQERDALLRIKDDRVANKDNMIGVAINAGLTLPNGESVSVIDFNNFEPEELLNRNQAALVIQNQYDLDLPQYFLPQEKQDIENIFASGSKEEIQNVMNSVIAMAGPNSPVAFEQLGIDGYKGLTHVGTLQTLPGNENNKHLSNAVDAFAKLNRPETKNDYDNFKVDRNNSELKNTTLEMLSFLKDNSFSDDTNTYENILSSAQIIFYGMIDKNPELKNMAAGDEPWNDDNVLELWEKSINIAAGARNGFGGIQDYFDSKVILPSWMPNTDNYSNAGEFAFVLGEIMTPELFDKATSVQVDSEFAGIDITEPKRNIPVEPGNNNKEILPEDIFGEDDVSLYAVEDGVYIIIEGDPITSTEQYGNASGDLVYLDLNKIRPEIEAALK